MKKGHLIVYSGPSGVGKGTIRNYSKVKNYEFSISSTTRKPRVGETNGVEYNFLTKEEFKNKIKNNEMLEYVEFVDNYYGTEKQVVYNLLNQGKNVFLEIDCQGALQVLKQIPEAISIFIMPPSLEELENRLYKRGTEEESVIKKRLEKAKEEIGYKDYYKYIIVNDDVEKASAKLDEILETLS